PARDQRGVGHYQRLPEQNEPGRTGLRGEGAGWPATLRGDPWTGLHGGDWHPRRARQQLDSDRSARGGVSPRCYAHRHDAAQRLCGRIQRAQWPGLLGAMGAGAVLVLGILFWAHAAATPRSAYHYRFARTPRGAVKQALQGEIEFYQARLTYDPNSGLNLAALAGAYLRMARATGDLRWYLIAEQTAQRSVASLPFQNNGALIVLARVAEARHDFQQAISLARRAGSAEALSIIVTSNLAMGKIDEAARAAGILIQGGAGLTS